jgi:hypothetical protein
LNIHPDKRTVSKSFKRTVSKSFKRTVSLDFPNFF